MVGVPMRRAQVSVMIILGVLLLGIAGGAIAVSKKVVNTRQEANLKLQIRDVFETGSVENYIQLCVSDALQEALLLVGEQGGILLAPQVGGFSNTGGSVACDPVTDTPRPFPQCPVDLGGDMVGLYRVGAITPGFTAPASSYPADLYGLPTMPGLFPCHDEGYSFNPDNPCRYPDRGQPNLGSRDHLPRLCKSNADIIACSAVPTDGSNFRAVQSQMEYHMAESIDTCVAIGIAGFAQDGLNVTPEPSSVSLTLGERATSAVANVPVLIKAHKTGTQKSFTFTANEAVGLPRSFALMQQLISQDTGDIDFHLGMPSTWPESLAVPAGMQVLLRRDFYGTDDLLIINDTASVLRGHPYVLRFLISDRPPMLKRIGFDAGPDFDMIVPVGAKLEFRPLADDPDDDKVTYTYHGWKADYEDLRDDAGNLHRVLHSAMATVPANAWQTSAFYTAPAAGQCDNPLTGQPEPGRCASYQTTADDAGDHVIVIVARAGTYVDWQRVRIRIEGSPEATASGNNPYPDMDPNLASFEDPYMLSGIGSDQATAGSGIYSYEWKLFKPGDSTPTHTFTVGDPEVWLTTLTRNLAGHLNEWAPVAPLSIWDDFPRTYADIDSFPSGRKGFTAIGDWRAELVVRTADGSASTPVERSIQVQACLPHRNDAAPYPFNKVQGDTFTTDAEDFFANHTCCAANGTIKEASDQCYQFSEYTCRTFQFDTNTLGFHNPLPRPAGHYFYDAGIGATVDFISDQNLFPKSAVDSGILPSSNTKELLPTNMPFNSLDGKNDVFKRTFMTKCSNERGNVCNGEIVETIQQSESCTRYQYCLYGNETCQNWTYSGTAANAILCKAGTLPAPRCSLAVGRGTYNVYSTTGKYLVRPVVNGDGMTCDATSGTASAENAYGGRVVDANGILLPEGSRYFVGIDCDYYDHYLYESVQDNRNEPGIQTNPALANRWAMIQTLSDAGGVSNSDLPGLRSERRVYVDRYNSVHSQPDDSVVTFQQCLDCTGLDYSCASVQTGSAQYSCGDANQVSVDAGQSWCDDAMNRKCGGASCYVLGGLNTNGVNTGTLGSVSGQYGCCGDKASEQFAQCGSDDSDAVCSTINSYKRVCCDAATDCVDDYGNCVDAGTSDTFGGSHRSYCANDGGKGVWQDPDTSSSFCAVATGDSNNYIYSSGSDQNRCCGDDPGETWGIPSADTNGHLACCNGNVVDANSYCESPINKWLFLDHDPVSYITSSDYRVTSVPSRSNSGGWNANACTGTSANGKVCAKTNTASGMGICIGTTCYSNVVAGIHITYESVSQGALFHPAVVYGASLASGCTCKNEVCDSNVNSDGFGFKATGYCAGLGGNCIACGTENANSCYDGFDADCDGRVSCEDSTCRDDNHLCTAGDKCKTPPGGGSKRCVASPNTCIAYVGVGWQEFSSGVTHTVSGTQYYCNGGDWIDDPDDAPAFCTAAGHTSIYMVGGSNKCCGDDGGSTDTFIGLVQACCQGTVVNQGDSPPACGGTLQWDVNLGHVVYVY